ncbi:hypothetical protein SELMODRAFT_91609 [Selaginella moellendorffii]|uniref:Mitochondrial inner membrane protease subunit 2 n=1 Tax=Selaginella moellendorffii TaxID=88036 RepID=D8RE78_SELML|nr:mitochondrial inner membrane protease subunit 2 [Selaginella moellendorffii]EFJ29391.1 hypothetical protein SELMODRAFT_91609 [Selaginella moellendorffii]|eukprot:XP_002969303.1 mitochondrial inner membrane protease subunit 2 [Selaginella moellendorffii]
MGWALLLAKRAAIGAMIGIAVSDELVSLARMQGSSMEPTLVAGKSLMEGDVLLLDKFPGHDFGFSRGDVVVLRSPHEPQYWMVKRLIAVEGDMLRVPGKRELVQVPKGRCWVEGDNANVSLDSRNMGPIPMALLKARVTRVVWPPERFGRVESILPTGRIVAHGERPIR